MASRITNICRPFPPIKVLASEQQGAKVGVTTTDVVKERSRVDLQRLLRLETFNVVREGDLISTHAGVSTELRKQLVALCSREHGDVRDVPKIRRGIMRGRVC